MKFGAHMSSAGGPWRALQRGRLAGVDVVQFFVKNNMQWFGKPCALAHLKLYAEELAANRFAAVFGHTGYLINLAAPASPNRDRSIASLIQEIQFATDLNLPFLVMHPGAHLGTGVESGLGQVVKGLDEVFRATKASSVRIALENTAGQGTCLGDRLEQLGAIFDKVERPERLGFCLDTAHLFAAGYDIRTARGWGRAIKALTERVGLEQILAFHLNDSKTGLGSRVDRHAHIGQGHIGEKGFRHIVRDPRFKNHPGCLETPKSADLNEDMMNLATLRRLTGVT